MLGGSVRSNVVAGVERRQKGRGEIPGDLTRVGFYAPAVDRQTLYILSYKVTSL